MNQLIFFFNFLLLSGSIFAIQTARSLESFTELKVSESITVNLVKSNNNSAVVTVQSGDTEDLLTTVTDGTLRVQWKKGTGNNRTANVTLNYIKLEAITAMAGGKVKSEEVLQANDLKLDARSGGKINLEIDCVHLDAEVSSGSSIMLKGKTQNQVVEASSGASYKCEDLISETTSAEASSGASIIVYVTNTITAEANSGASIKYTGDPTNKELEKSDITGGRISSF